MRTSEIAAQGPPPSSSKQIAKLIGRKALTKSILNGLAVTSLIDTGAQVSIIYKSWKDKYLLNLDIWPLSEFIEVMEGKTQLDVYAENRELLETTAVFSIWIISCAIQKTFEREFAKS